jgi:hypothetical protein
VLEARGRQRHWLVGEVLSFAAKAVVLDRPTCAPRSRPGRRTSSGCCAARREERV